MTDWIEFRQALDNEFNRQKMEPTKIDTIAEFKMALKNLLMSLQHAKAEAVPILQITPFTKRWWTKDLATERNEVQKLA